jgi:hypothetical protein
VVLWRVPRLAYGVLPVSATILRVSPLAALALFCTAAVHADRTWTSADADALQRKIVLIAANGLAERPEAKRTTVTEREVNAFLQSRVDLPEGVVDPVVTILPDGRLTGSATVDLDVVRAAKPRGTLSPWNLVSGRLPLEVSGVLTTGDGVGAFSVERAMVSGVPVPKSLLHEVVNYYSRSDVQPEGVDIEAPFRLPARIREIQTTQGEAFVVQ